MNGGDISPFTESLTRCLARPEFLDRFYELFLGASDEIAERFRSTDFEKQKQALSQSLYLMVMAMEGSDAATAYLDKMARRHGREELDVRPEFYDLWLDCLVRSAREHDPEYSDELEQSWRETMKFGIEFMRERY